ncbi:histidine kinase [Streptomyces sp. NPDC003077]|uniref:sensor histidine kinase n=1 Tax=Streptomyces sp. NPDC003077 TaxID=3154443 RepID=UPI0033AB065A
MGRFLRGVGLWALLVAPVVAEIGAPGEAVVSWWWAVGGPVLLAVAVALTRRAPAVALLVVAGVALTCGPTLLTASYVPALAVTGYLLGRRAARPRPALLAFAVMALASLVTSLAGAQDPVAVWLLILAALLVGAVFPWLVGRYRRQERALAAAGWGRAEQLARERAVVADRARLRERARIAQDMHDSLGHELSLLALRAAALQVAPGMSAAHREAARELRTAAADATERLREIIGVLRERETTEAEQDIPLAPAGESIEALVHRAAASGLRVRMVTGADGPSEGEAGATDGVEVEEAGGVVGPVGPEGPVGSVGAVGPAGSVAGVPVSRTPDRASAPPSLGPPAPPPPAAPLARLSPQAERAAHRVVQEALTNAARHAPGAQVTVRAEGTEDGGAVVTIVNTAAPERAPGAGPPRPGGGTGLIGLRERVRLAGGTLEAGPHEGGYRVRARLPGAGAAPYDDRASASYDAVYEGPTATPYDDRSPTSGNAPPEAPAPAPAAEFLRARRAGRRSLLVYSAVAASVALAVVGAFTGYHVYAKTHSVLAPADYRALRVGQPHAEVAAVLPGREATDTPAERAPAPPPGASCAYYRSSGKIFGSVDHFRLCFRDGRLVSKLTVPTLASVRER